MYGQAQYCGIVHGRRKYMEIKCVQHRGLSLFVMVKLKILHSSVIITSPVAIYFLAVIR